MSYSLDDVLTPSPRQHVEHSLLTWIMWGHVPWVIGLMGLAFDLGRSVLLIGALAHLVALSFALLAWVQRRRSAWTARLVAWMSATLLGLGSGFCIVALVMSVVDAFTVPSADSNAPDDWSPLAVVILIVRAAVAGIVAVPTIAGFAAAIRLGRDLGRS